MATGYLSPFSDHTSGFRYRLTGIYALLVLINAGVWPWAVVAFRGYPVLWGPRFLLIAINGGDLSILSRHVIRN
jgi:hypothetical protein